MSSAAAASSAGAGAAAGASAAASSASASGSWESQLQSALLDRRWSSLLQLAQTHELEEGGVWSRDSELWFSIHLFSAALTDQTLTVKFVWKRIPADMKKKSKEIAATWKLVSALVQRDFATFFGASTSTAFASPLLQRLNVALREEVQSRNLLAIRTAYALISVEQAAPLLGLQAAQVAAFLTQQGWTADPQAPAHFFTPTPVDQKKAREISQAQIEQLTKYVTHLED